MYFYRAFGLNIASELELEHLKPVELPPDNRRDLTIEVDDLAETRAMHSLGAVDQAFISTEAGVVMHWRGVGTLLVSGGNRVRVDFDGAVDMSTRTLALTGPPMGVLLEQRGNLVLHGSAVVMNSKAVAFLGHKGFGKSTTAAALSQAGYPVITDDILAIDISPEESVVWPGLPVLKLWSSSRQAIYGSEQERGGNTGKRIRETPVDQDTPVPLGALFVLDMGETMAKRTIGREAFLGVMRNSYAGRFVGTAGTSPDHFTRCSEVASTVPVFRLRRPPTLESLPNVVSVVEETVRSLYG